MTQLIHFEELTWPEIACLPRNCPIILPIGNGFDWEKISEALSYPSQIAILPAFPYGWRGSLIPLPEQIFNRYIANLIQSIRDDGFTQVYALTNNGIQLELGAAQIVQPIVQRSSPAWNYSDIEKVVLLPIGHTEQHGYHLPLSTDTEIIQAITQGVINAIPEKATYLPTMPYGVSTHRNAFAGTMNAGGRAFEDFYLAVIDVLVLKGFTRFYLMSGHGGNCSFLVNVVKYAGERYPHIFCATSYLYLNTPEGIHQLETHRQSSIGGMGHACELETSLMLLLKPELVHIERVVDETEFIST
ncbi:MAG: creatininase family protein, partial [Anaerolineales bacterium]